MNDVDEVELRKACKKHGKLLWLPPFCLALVFGLILLGVGR